MSDGEKPSYIACMHDQLNPRTLSDDELLQRVADIVRRSRHAEAEILAHIAEVDARRLYLRQACSSMFAYCTGILHFSEAESFLRIAAARASREHPILLSMLADGRLHLSAVARLSAHLTAVNRDAVLARAVHKSKREIEELIAELAPRPDAPDTIRKLPHRGGDAALALSSGAKSPCTGVLPGVVAQGWPRGDETAAAVSSFFVVRPPQPVTRVCSTANSGTGQGRRVDSLGGHPVATRPAAATIRAGSAAWPRRTPGRRSARVGSDE